MRHRDTWGKIILGRVNNKNKGSEVGMYLSPHMTPLILQDQGKQMHLMKTVGMWCLACTHSYTHSKHTRHRQIPFDLKLAYKLTLQSGTYCIHISWVLQWYFHHSSSQSWSQSNFRTSEEMHRSLHLVLLY